MVEVRNEVDLNQIAEDDRPETLASEPNLDLYTTLTTRSRGTVQPVHCMHPACALHAPRPRPCTGVRKQPSHAQHSPSLLPSKGVSQRPTQENCFYTPPWLRQRERRASFPEAPSFELGPRDIPISSNGFQLPFIDAAEATQR